jgi:hypothetical protein
MIHFLLYQLFPLAALWIAFSALARIPSFRRWGVPAVFLAGAALQFAFWMRARPDLDNPDSLGFFRLGHGLETDLRALLFRPKLYPLFLGLFHSLKAAVFWQGALKLAMGGLLVRFGRICGWKPAATAMALFLFLFDSLWLSEPMRILDTTLFSFLFASFLLLAAETLRRYSDLRFAALCLAAGLTTLCRQAGDVSMALVLALVVAVILYRAIVGTLEPAGRRGGSRTEGVTRVLRPMALALAAALALAGSAAWYNGAKYGAYRRSVAVGINLYTHASYYRLHDPASREWLFVEHFLPGARRRYPPWETGYGHDMPWAVNDLPHRLERKMGTTDAEGLLDADRLLRGRFLDWALEYPAEYLASVANEAMRLLSKCEEIYPASLLDPERRHPGFIRRLERGIIHQPPWLLLIAGLAALIAGRRNRLLLLVPTMGAASYLALVAAVQIGMTRYALPAMLPLLMLAGEAFDRLPAFRRRGAEIASVAEREADATRATTGRDAITS